MGAIPRKQKGRITMAVAVVEDTTGRRFVLIGTSEPDGYLGPGVVLRPGERMVGGIGHAEKNIVEYAQANQLRLIDIGATRPICVPCQDLIIPTGANISTPVLARP
jgi:filamentous hemagglutinin